MTGTGTTGAGGVGAARRLERWVLATGSSVPAETVGREEVAAGAGWVDRVRREGRFSQRDGIVGALHQNDGIIGRVGEQSNGIGEFKGWNSWSAGHINEIVWTVGPRDG